MESYEEFCSKSLARLQTEGRMQMCGESSSQQEALSIIRFHGRAVLSPLLSVDQRREMTQYRQRAVQLEADRQSLRRQSRLLARVQDIIDSVQVRKGGIDSEDAALSTCFPKKPEQKNGLALLPNMSSPPRGGGAAGGANRGLPPEWGSPPFPNGTGEGAEARGEGDEGGGRLSLQVVLKRSREFLERERSRRGSWGSCRSAPATPGDSLSDKENEDGRGPARRPPGVAGPTDSTDSLYGCTPHSLTGSYAQLPSPEPSLSPRPHRRRPRPVSAGNILISCPVSAAELSPGELGRGQEGDARADGGALADDASPEKRSPDGRSPAGSLPSTGSDRNSTHSDPSLVCDPATPVSTSVRSAAEQDGFSPGFRRRSHTLDSPPPPPRSGPPLDWSQEKAPRLPGGVGPQAASRRSPPAALNQSYDVESPSPTLQRPHVTSGPTPGHAKHGSPEGQLTPLSTPSREQHRPTEEEVQWQVQALEEVQRRMAEEHAQQLSLLIAEQEREHQRLRQALQEKEWRLREQEGDQAADWRALSVSCPTLSPTESSPGQNAHSTGVSSFVSPSAPSPAAQPSLCPRGPPWGTGKPPGRANQVATPELQGALCRLGALARGFLTRRLLKTEKLKHLRQTILDTQEFIRSFQTEAPQKRGSLSAQDIALQDRVRAQLRAALFDVHDIFFVMPTEERLALLQQDRELRAERKLREMEKAKSPRERAILSAATQRSLERKKQRFGSASGQGKRIQPRTQGTSPSMNRVLQPKQGQNSPVPGQMLRKGNPHRRTAEERVKCSECLKKQQSLGAGTHAKTSKHPVPTLTPLLAIKSIPTLLPRELDEPDPPPERPGQDVPP
ncbi:hypothetical protein MATL_G00003290 [Megalops atlanticus]|uniref:Centriolar coiled coil protein 110kDa n=1 Tax=Megalops atlanticus TaxID=7932 RepID=A0A9D3QK45_MEGAT|nr:hypothetical protein MATL_G00003290 [Megalops atlanticus]